VLSPPANGIRGDKNETHLHGFPNPRRRISPLSARFQSPAFCVILPGEWNSRRQERNPSSWVSQSAPADFAPVGAISIARVFPAYFNSPIIPILESAISSGGARLDS
jgi:hypothetical protein